MELKRAAEILNSQENVNVYYHENPVWIEDIHTGFTAHVRPLNNDKVMEVMISDLSEQR